MNYQHIYHAGSFQDVFKHIILISVIESLLKKPTAFCYFDIHAGAGCYDLLSDKAQKTKEFETGIAQIFKQPQQSMPDVVKKYLSIVKSVNENDTLRYYPGSPLIAHALLRSQDHMQLIEIHPEVYENLKKLFLNDDRVAVHERDSYQSLKALLPPKEKRGLVLIDPPFENKKEYELILNGLKFAFERWKLGIYLIWYPIKSNLPRTPFIRALKENKKTPLLITELTVYPEDSPLRLNGCGFAIINPPWQLDQHLSEILPWLWEALSHQGQGDYHIKSYN